MANFDDVWKTLEVLNSIPITVTAEIDILKGANLDFIKFVAELESITDFDIRAQKAKDYIDKHNGIKEIDYITLGKYLANTKATPLEIWRQLYVLERSIKPRFGDHYTWLDRLRMFYNTYIRENAIAGKAIYRGKKIYFIKGNEAAPTNHDKLVYGHGQWGADFYFYDDSREGDQTWQKMVKVEMKHCDGNLDTAVKKYADNEYSYGAKYLILAMANGSYFMVDYTDKESPVVTNLNINCPDVYII